MAVHALTVLAYKEGDRVSSAFLAGRVNTNPVMIRRLLLDLQRAKLVETNKGAGAGSRLSRSPGRINLAEIFRAVEELETFARPSGKPNQACPVAQCMREELDRVFASARAALERDLERTTLADLMAAAKACACGHQKTAKKSLNGTVMNVVTNRQQ